MTPNTFYYDHQIKRYEIQFMAIFAGMQVQVGKMGDVEPRLADVPIRYGESDKVVAAILADNTTNALVRLPIMSAYHNTIQMAPDRRHGVGIERRVPYVPVGGMVPDDIKVVHQLMPVPYNLEMELCLFASNNDQHLQMLEQILLLFDPALQLQTSDNPLDWARLNQVELKNITLDTNYPLGTTQRRIIKSRLMFDMPIWLSAPASVKQNYVNQVLVRIGTVSGIVGRIGAGGAGGGTEQSVIDDLNAQGIDYGVWQDGSNTPPF